MTTAADIRRVVVIHGAADRELTDLLTRQGLATVVDTGETTIWAPAPPVPPVGAEEAEAERDPAVLVDIVTAARRLGIGRSSIYRLIEDGQLDVVHVGRSARIPADAIDDLVDRLRARKQRSLGDRTIVGHVSGRT